MGLFSGLGIDNSFTGEVDPTADYAAPSSPENNPEGHPEPDDGGWFDALFGPGAYAASVKAAEDQQRNFDPANPGTSAENIGTQGDDPGNGNENGSEPIVPIDLTPDPRDIDWFHPLAQQEYEAPGVRNFSKFMPRGVQQNRGLFRGPNLSKGKGALYQPWTREGGSRYVPKSIWNYDPVELTDWSGGLL